MENKARSILFNLVARKKSAGFGMLDLLLWIGMVGILAAIMAPGIKYGISRVNRFATERVLDKVDFALSQYSLDMNGFPGKKEGGLTALVYRPQGDSSGWQGSYLVDLKYSGDMSSGIEIMDSWKRPLEYNRPPINFPNKYKQYELISYGVNEDDQNGYITRGQ